VLALLVSGLLDMLAPPECPACALPYEPSGAELGLCPACAPLIEPTPPARQPPAVDAAICLYQGPMADAIRRFKYADQRQLLRHFLPLLMAAAQPYAGLIDAVVPVPLHPCKLRQRGWNPAALLARPIASTLGIPLRTGWLRRTRETAVQAGLSRAARTQNVRGAFRAVSVAPARILLVDDVRTTGATLLEAASCLAEAGHTVSTLALAWALQDPDEPSRSESITRSAQKT
jgi:ComF family protein